MNDTELDDLLNQWEAPPAPESLRMNTQTGYSTLVGRKKKTRSPLGWLMDFAPVSKRTLFAGIAMGAGAFLLLLVTQAFPQTLWMAGPLIRIPYTVDSEFVHYSETGPEKVVMYMTSYSENGTEIPLSTSLPGDSLRTAIRRTLDVAGFVFYKLAGRSAPAAAAFIRAGCVSGPVLTHETILGFSTVVVESRMGPHQRVTRWMSPDLGCFALRLRIEEQRADGAFRVVTERHALRVALNH